MNEQTELENLQTSKQRSRKKLFRGVLAGTLTITSLAAIQRIFRHRGANTTPAPTSTTTKIQVKEAVELSRQDEALLESGKKLVVESIDATRDFVKTILATSSSFALLYLTILNFLKESIRQLSISERVLIVVPSGFFILSTTFAIITFFPRADRFSLNILDEIEESRNRWLRSKRKNMAISVVMFLIGILSITVAFGYLLLKMP